jgi:molybdopterin-dependent oxidoreductase alpha subunit
MAPSAKNKPDHQGEQPDTTGAQSPANFTGLRLKTPPRSVAGIPAVAQAMKQILRYTHPTATLPTLFRLNQKGGIDCPGCAWPDPDDDRSSLGEYCENGVKAIAEERSAKTIGRDFFGRHSIAEMLQWSDFEIGKKGRLAEPMVLRENDTHYRPISWEAAFQMIADELNALESPDEAIFYTSGRTSNEAAFLYQLFVRAYGTNNLPDCSNMCHESSGVALSETLGIGKGSVTLGDFYEAELVIVIGQNPGTNHPRMLAALEKCKENGGQIISINPLPEPGLMRFVDPQDPLKILKGGTALTDLFLQVKVNGDVPLLKAIMKLLDQADRNSGGKVFDHEFIQAKTRGLETLLEHLREQDYDMLIQDSGIPDVLVREATEMIRNKKKIIICWAMGVTQHENGVDNIREIVNLLLLKGSIGKPGAGTCPVRGHSNVQGDRTMGIWEAPPQAFLDKLGQVFRFKAPNRHGYAVTDAIKAMYEKKASVFFAMGGNFLSATPDTEYTAQGLRNCRLTVQVSTKLNRSHLIHGKNALILPCLGRTDLDLQASGPQFVSVENSMGVVQSSEGKLPPVSDHLLSEPAIVAGLAKAVLGDKLDTDWDKLITDYDCIREHIEKVIPGFENYNKRIRKPGGFYLPNGPREGNFTTPDGKARFTVNAYTKWKLSDGSYLMITIRSHDQFNTTIYGLDDRYRGIYQERRVVLMNPEDINTAGLRPRQVVNLLSIYNGIERRANRFIIVPFDIPKSCIATYFPEANVLVPADLIARGSKTPVSKSVIVKIELPGQ